MEALINLQSYERKALFAIFFIFNNYFDMVVILMMYFNFNLERWRRSGQGLSEAKSTNGLTGHSSAAQGTALPTCLDLFIKQLGFIYSRLTLVRVLLDLGKGPNRSFKICGGKQPGACMLRGMGDELAKQLRQMVAKWSPVFGPLI
jgi:hypothetical protein